MHVIPAIDAAIVIVYPSLGKKLDEEGLVATAFQRASQRENADPELTQIW